MHFWQRELNVARIISGTLRFKTKNARGLPLSLLIDQPSRQQRYLAQELYADTLREAELRGLFSEEELFDYLMVRGLWDEERQELLEKLPKEIEQFKVALLNATFKSNERRTIRQCLKIAKEKYVELYTQRNNYNHLSCQGTAAVARTRYLLGCSLIHEDGQPFFKNFWEDSDSLLDKALDFYSQSHLDEADYRELARTDPWRSFWSLRSEEQGLFGRLPVDLTDEQKILVSWSKIYDSAWQHPEGPADEVVEDDDLFDGWLILQRRKREKQNEQSIGNNLLSDNPKIRNAKEQFYVAETAEDAQKIYGLNDEGSRHVLRKRFQHLEKCGEVAEVDMPDTKREIRMQLTQKLAQSMNGGKRA